MNEIHYDAFISYRHTDIDAAIAEAIHKKLEHYHIPKHIQKKSGKNPLQESSGIRKNYHYPLIYPVIS